ncbi:MAG: hypothetical protein KatS3mg119_2421 [Rhodothalassiaceae bacterium]|nr:MAG: hypothetical protein KatS3mg119_2421 [Rhodothalassiaceae bacterium]
MWAAGVAVVLVLACALAPGRGWPQTRGEERRAGRADAGGLPVRVRPAERRPMPPVGLPDDAAPERWVLVPTPQGPFWVWLAPPRDGDGGPPDPLRARAERLLRPQLVAGGRSGPATAVSFAEVMGPAWRNLSDAEIYRRFGFMPDGTKPADFNRGIYSGLRTRGGLILLQR